MVKSAKVANSLQSFISLTFSLENYPNEFWLGLVEDRVITSLRKLVLSLSYVLYLRQWPDVTLQIQGYLSSIVRFHVSIV